LFMASFSKNSSSAFSFLSFSVARRELKNAARTANGAGKTIAPRVTLFRFYTSAHFEQRAALLSRDHNAHIYTHLLLSVNFSAPLSRPLYVCNRVCK